LPIEEGKLFTARPSNITPDRETGIGKNRPTPKSSSQSARVAVRTVR
jgi:hypothetical protein